MDYQSLEKISLMKITTFWKTVFQTNLIIQGGELRPKNEYNYQKEKIVPGNKLYLVVRQKNIILSLLPNNNNIVVFVDSISNFS